jgi:hypothetical protein
LVFSCSYGRLADEKTFEILAGDSQVQEALRRI